MTFANEYRFRGYRNHVIRPCAGTFRNAQNILYCIKYDKKEKIKAPIKKHSNVVEIDYLNSFLKAANGPPLALMIFMPVMNLLNGKILFMLTKR